MAKDGKMINSTHSAEGGQTEGLNTTLKAYEEYDMNMLNDPTGKHKEWQPSGNLGGKKK